MRIPSVSRVLQRTDQLVRRLGFAPGRIETPKARWAGITLRWKPDPPEVTRGAVVEASIDGEQIRFFVNDDSDLIQNYHLRGTFFEADELKMLALHFAGGLFVDVGANVGNHLLYALKFLGADRVIAFEPNPVALKVLELNVRLNGLSDRVRIHQLGLSDHKGRVTLKLPYSNIGGAWLEPSEDGALEIAVGDELLAGEPVRFIKIDTEGMEMNVLRGLRETVRRNRPTLFVEVANENIPAFQTWCAEMAYRVEETGRLWAANVNFLALPMDEAPVATQPDDSSPATPRKRTRKTAQDRA